MEPEIRDDMLPISAAVKVLRENLNEISSTEEWAVFMNWDCAVRFSRMFRKHTGKRPSQVLIETKIETAVKLLQEKPVLNCFDIAKHIGKADDKALNKYLKYHTGRVPMFIPGLYQSFLNT